MDLSRGVTTPQKQSIIIFLFTDNTFICFFQNLFYELYDHF